MHDINSVMQGTIDTMLEVLQNFQITVPEIEEGTGISKTSLYKWFRGESTPYPKNLGKLRTYINERLQEDGFNKSILFEIQGHRVMFKIEEILQQINHEMALKQLLDDVQSGNTPQELSNKELKFLEDFRGLTEENQRLVLLLMKGLMDDPKTDGGS